MGHFLGLPLLQLRQVKCNKEYCERTTAFGDMITRVLLSSQGTYVTDSMLLTCSASRNVKGNKILEGFLPPLKTPACGISVVSAWCSSSLAVQGSALANRALEAVFLGFEVNGYLPLHGDPGLPTFRFPPLQNREILPMITAPRSDVVIKMAL